VGQQAMLSMQSGDAALSAARTASLNLVRSGTFSQCNCVTSVEDAGLSAVST